MTAKACPRRRVAFVNDIISISVVAVAVVVWLPAKIGGYGGVRRPPTTRRYGKGGARGMTLKTVSRLAAMRRCARLGAAAFMITLR